MRAVLLAAVASLALPAGAHAATVSATEQLVEPQRGGAPFLVSTVAFAAEPGEVNDVVASVAGGVATFRDASVPVRAGAGCEQVAPGEARCPVRPSASGLVEVGDGDDRVLVTVGALAVRGGTGRDVLRGSTSLDGGEGDDDLRGANAGLTGGAGADLLVLDARGQVRAGPGDDRVEGSGEDDHLSGGGGRDVLLGAGGDDVLSDDDGPRGDPYVPERAPTPVDADVLDGGPGRDEVDYTGRRAALVVDLSRDGPIGEAGEGDLASGLEVVGAGAGDDRLVASPRGGWLRGEDGDDTLVGGAAAERLQGDRGADRLTAGPGDDQLAGGRGGDRLDGGPGDDGLDGGGGADRVAGGPGADGVAGGEGVDVLLAGDGRDRLLASGDYLRDRISCGAGRDRVDADPGEVPAGSCERVRRVAFEPLFSLGTRSVDGPPRAGVAADGVVRLGIDCLDRLPSSCRGRVTLRLELPGARPLEGRFGCGAAALERGDVDCEATVAVRGLRLGAVARAALRRRGRLRATVAGALSPGAGRGALVQRVALTLVLEPRG